MKKNNIFWIGYSDLMTSLFFIMMVLFVVTIGYLQYQKIAAEKEGEATKKELEKIQELQTAIQNLPAYYFDYQPEYKRFKLNRQIQFDTGSPKIKSQYHDYLIDVGKSINNLIDSLYSNEKYKNFDIKYLVVIEGMASKDNYPRNFELSYERAFALYNLWKSENIKFEPEKCEIQIAGSGTEGVREFSGTEEYKNQQFLIHIVPKLGKIIEK